MLTTAAIPTTIREAVETDVDRLVEMGMRFRRESVYASRLPENPEQMAALSHLLISSPDGLVLIAEKDGIRIGMIGLLIFRHHFSGALTAGELVFYVEPEHRGCGIRLLKQAEIWAKTRGARTIQMIAPTLEVGQLYERLGYHALEMAFEKDLVCQ